MILHNIITPKKYTIITNRYTTKKSIDGRIGEILRQVHVKVNDLDVKFHVSKYNENNNRYIHFAFQNNNSIMVDFDNNNETTFYNYGNKVNSITSIPNYYDKVIKKYCDFIKSGNSSYGWEASINTIKVIQKIRGSGICMTSI